MWSLTLPAASRKTLAAQGEQVSRPAPRKLHFLTLEIHILMSLKCYNQQGHLV